MPYICPICESSLKLDNRTWRCSQNHCFDIAKEGYVNLLPVQKKKSKDPGDNQLMMQARREFLNQGHYQFLSDRVNVLLEEHLKNHATMLDLGCGEGYYTGRLAEALQVKSLQIYGLDISKVAVRYGAKRYKDITFCVASAFDTPFAPQSLDAVLRIYAPSKLEELKRIIKPGGVLLTVSAGPIHHWFLKTVIYKEPKPHPEETDNLDGFELIFSERLQQKINLKQKDDIENFLNMTPYAWKLDDSQKQQLCQQGLECELDFKLQLHRRQ
ncbi:23S rRNA (guanine(745)-N(1))-methyltransferase [Parashewanella curva]|uniref:23S rRNA (Guanine(745)-N(1))-methyltransferase n=1 Tax=Parashewanella curva TaxID=2338552 RepID=A0A3L8Q2B0_9GAMM|nr:23S rRNA (guanine(745)-N(1))-methyltransferase [Parashewanella curva]RLV61149.1 23S rRNA (guanine(745)-N(1))-methyltransferase [Parashewanella curva]